MVDVPVHASESNVTKRARTAAIVREFAEAAQFQAQRDQKLWGAVDLLLTEIGADALVFRSGPDNQVLSVFKTYLQYDRGHKDEIVQRLIATSASERLNGHACQLLKDADFEIDALYCLPDFGFVTEAGHVSSPHSRPFFAFLKCKKVSGGYGYSRWTRTVALEDGAPGYDALRLDQFETYCRTVQLAFAKRAEADEIFPSRLSQAFWNAVDDELETAGSMRPWEGRGGLLASRVTTVSLSFDIRKSTFVMENAIDSQIYADWIDGLVVLLKDIVHTYGGVFDKFTGDGTLAHFPPISAAAFKGEPDSPTRRQLAVQGMICAWEMLLVFEQYSQYLLPNLSLTRKQLGASVGMALDNAHWSVDRTGAPIVVGRGVVHACRASGGPAGTVQGTNAILQAVSRLYEAPGGFKTIEFVSKENPEGTDVELTRFLRPIEGYGRPRHVLWTLCERVRKEIQGRRGALSDFNFESLGVTRH